MPFKSESQRRYMFAAQSRGEIPKGTAERWQAHTPKDKKLPEHVKKTAMQLADEVLSKLAGGVAAFKANPAVGKKGLIEGLKKRLPEQPKTVEWRKSMAEKPKGEPEMLKFFSLKEAAGPDAEVLDAALLKSKSGASKLWQGLTGLSDDLLMAGMNLKQKAERKQEKHAAQQFASSISMLTKMSDVSKKEVEHFFQENPNPEDEKLHAWAEKKKENKHEVEDKAYELATAEAKRDSKGDKIEGGKADGKPKSDFDPKQLAMGEKVEREHTNDPSLAAEISTDHLEEIPDYYTRLKKMEDAAPKQADQQGLLQEQPLQGTAPMATLPPDILQLLRAQALIDQEKMAKTNDSGDVRIPYQREKENEGQDAPDLSQDQALRQARYEQELAEQMRAQKVEHEYTSRVRRGELVGGAGGIAGGAGLGALLSKPGGRFFPIAAGASLGGLLGKGLGRHVGQNQGLDYLQQYSGTPWTVQ